MKQPSTPIALSTTTGGEGDLSNYKLHYIIQNLILTLLSLFKKQFKFLFSPSLYAWNHFPLVAPEGDILLINIPVSGFQFLNQSALGYLSIAYQTVITHII